MSELDTVSIHDAKEDFGVSFKKSKSKYKFTKFQTMFHEKIFRSLLRFGIERTPSPKKGHLLAEEYESDDGSLKTSRM